MRSVGLKLETYSMPKFKVLKPKSLHIDPNKKFYVTLV